jgi:virulence-associated protein VagC
MVYSSGVCLFRRGADVARSTIFKTNRSQAVRLPKLVALPASVRQVEITKTGRSRLISPADQFWMRSLTARWFPKTSWPSGASRRQGNASHSDQHLAGPTLHPW